MCEDEENQREKIITNGFNFTEFLRFKKIFTDIRKTLHPKLTAETTLQSIIINNALASFSTMRFYFFIFFLYLIGCLLFSSLEILITPPLIIMLAIYEAYLSAKEKKIKFTSELKLIKLAIRLKL